MDETGEPVPNVDVSASRLGYGPTGRRRIVVQQTTTDDLGRFRLHSLPAGDYTVHAAMSRRDVVRRLDVPGERVPGFARTYYPGTPRAHEAWTLHVDAGQEVSGLDLALTTVPLVGVTVRVVDSGGMPPASSWIRLEPVDGFGDSVWGLRDPRATGVATFPRVPPGDYWVAATVVSRAGSPPEFAVQRLSVSGDAAEDVVLRAEPGARIAGRVEVEATERPPGLSLIRIVAHPVDVELPTPDGATSGVRAVSVAPDGRFTFESLFGARLFRVAGLPAGWAPCSMTTSVRSAGRGS